MVCSAPLTLLAMAAAQAPGLHFRINCIDAATGRGVPLVELRTTGNLGHVSDSNGIVAFHEPGLMGREVWFDVASHGYEVAPDGFGFRGVRLTPVAGERAEVRLRRINVAERLYRVTGSGIYRDSLLVGAEVPLREPVLSGGVVGQDSVVAIPYRGVLRWFWGDTNRAAYPLGNFAASGAVSELPERGGLDPSVGVDLSYFVDERGFSRPMVGVPGPGPKWLGGLVVVPGPADGGPGSRERLVAQYVRVESLGKLHERGLVLWDDERERFEKLVEFDLADPLFPSGHALEVDFDGEPYFVFGEPFPAVRVPRDFAALQDPRRYEAFTCLAQGGAPIEEYGWKRDTAAVHMRAQEELVASGQLAAGDAWLQLRDVETGATVVAHGGSVYWNEYRRRFVAIVLEVGGSSFLGEIWYAEGDTLLGPWVYARKVVTHDAYSFYNPTQHPWFDQEGGRLIYFEGTYTVTFSSGSTRTPRYDYNQVMYRLALDDPRLALPVPVYRLADGILATGAGVEERGAWDDVEAIPFFALDRARPGAVEVPGVGWALAPGAEAPETLPLARAPDGAWTTDVPPDGAAVARVWRSPSRHRILAPGARPR